MTLDYENYKAVARSAAPPPPPPPLDCAHVHKQVVCRARAYDCTLQVSHFIISQSHLKFVKCPPTSRAIK